MKSRILCFVFTACLATPAAQAGKLFFFTKAAMRDTHNAFVDLILSPDSPPEQGVCADYQSLSLEKKLDLWKEAELSPDIKSALTIFSNLDLLMAGYLPQLFSCFRDEDRSEETKKQSQKTQKRLGRFFSTIKKRPLILSFSDLNQEQKSTLLSVLIQSGDNFYRRIGFSIKTWYTVKSFEGRMGECFTGFPERGDETADPLPSIPSLKTPFSLERSGQRLSFKPEYIVVGSGAAASVVASGLQQAGKKVLVLEKGPLFMPGAINATDNFKFMSGGGLMASSDGGMFFMNGEVSGGGATVNIDMSYPPTLPYISKRFRSWRENGIIPSDTWDEASLQKGWEWVRKTFQPRTVNSGELNTNNAILRSGAELLGLSWKWYELNTYAPGESPYQITHKKSALERLLLPAMTAEYNPLTLLPDSEVTKVQIKNGVAKGVWFRVLAPRDRPGILPDPYRLNLSVGKELFVEADKVILAAGNLGSSVILLNSETGNESIGKGFVAHPFVMVMGRFPHPVNAHLGTPSTVFIDHFLSVKDGDNKPGFLIESAAGNPAAAAILLPGSPSQIREHMKSLQNIAGAGVILVEDVSQGNRITLDRKGRPRIHYSLSEADKKRFRLGISKTAEILLAAGAEKIAFNTYDMDLRGGRLAEFPFIRTAAQVKDIQEKLKLLPNQGLLMGAHMMAGNKMGVDPASSVVGSDHQVWGVSGLYVVDGSVFPESVGANPMQSIYTIARLFVEKHLSGK